MKKTNPHEGDEKPIPEKPESQESQPEKKSRLAQLSLAALGHFGPRPIRLTWFTIVFPALVLNYFGQGALLLVNPEAASHPFYAMVPAWAMIPTVLLATLATIIASQAVISGAFSMTRQAIQLGYLPRLNIRHTAATQIGQIYVAPVNWMLMVCTISLVAGFQSSSKLAAAYGLAVTSTMIINTVFPDIVGISAYRICRFRLCCHHSIILAPKKCRI